MVKVVEISLNPGTMEADVFLMADTKDEVTNDPTDAIGMPEGYKFAPFSKCMTKSKELAILGSDGEWTW